MDSKRYIIDIGANNGEFILPIAQTNPNHRAIAFEPNEELFLHLEAAKTPNLEIIKGAVGAKREKLMLNISDKGDKGTSSLLNFSKKIKEDSYWRERSDLVFDRQEEVQVDTLEAWLSKYEIDSIDFLKIDTQGFDLIALESLGVELLGKVKFGVLEVPATDLNHLYEGDGSDLTAALAFLKDNNFSIFKVEPNDEGFREYNVYFYQNGINPVEIEEELELKKNKIYNGNLPVMLADYENSYERKLRSSLGLIKRALLGYLKPAKKV